MATPSRRPAAPQAGCNTGCSPIRPAPRSGDVVLPVRNGCCGKDLGPLEDHEAPSEADIERFSDATRTCPKCKEDVYDDAEICYHCGEAFISEAKPVPKWAMVAAGLVVVGFLLLLVR